MRKLLLSCCFATLVLALSCSDNKSTSGIIDPAINYDDIVGSWRGTLDSWRVNNSADRKSYTLKNVSISLIFDSQYYWLQLTQFSDSLEYQYYNRGFWLWDPYVPDVMVFELYEEYSTQIFNPVQSGGGMEGLDSTGTGTGGGAAPDTVKIVKGDNTKMEARFISFMDLDLGTNQMRLYDFIEYLDFGDVTLEKY